MHHTGDPLMATPEYVLAMDQGNAGTAALAVGRDGEAVRPGPSG